MEILKGDHVSQDTAYVVEDYPYGFRLRCKIRYWLETRPDKGTRLWSQTTNPKRGDVWNKAKASTYARFGGVMYLDDEGHVQWTGLTEHTNAREAEAWLNTWIEGMSDPVFKLASMWVKAKKDYEAKRDLKAA